MLFAAFSVSAICAYVHFLLFLFKRIVYLYFHPAKIYCGKCSLNKLYEVDCKLKQQKYTMHYLYEGQSCTCAAVKGHTCITFTSLQKQGTFKRWKLSMCILYPFSSLPKNACTKSIKFSCNATFLYIKFSFEKYATCVLYVFILSQILQNMFRRICRRKHVWERSSSPKYMQASNGVHSASVKTKRKGMSIPFIQIFIYARGTTIFE